ncbi:hypothetical protein [Wolbachia endosymbiont of Folsomia candida]|uniref:hypothetical protein n=1 Tax=Wolbachia endosymbiont of Folsomia candida TaxID=169402 RepID=UPI000B6152B2|nr:hypothetical protein [Wolbachia endosymbiont of Folsomia candida]APR98565.1 hypothetical protein ASM33_04905 [Wolbachia endosymbiont of Folsomia candida]
MDLPSCQKQNPVLYRQIVTSLLQWNNHYDSPSKEFLEVAQYLSSLGFLNLREYYFIICANDSDIFDLRYVIDPFCYNRLEIESDYDEDYDNPIMCDLCERDILPNTYKKQRYYSLDVTINHLKVIEWFEEQLASLNITYTKVEIGVYYVIVGTSFVSLIIPEYCSDKSYLTIDKLRTNPTILICFGKDFKPLLNLYVVFMADLFCNYQTLNKVLNEAVEKGVPELLPNVSFQALNCYSYVSLQHTKPTLPEKILELQIKGNDICLNNIEVIDKLSKYGIIFFIFLDQFFHDFKAGIPPKQYKALKIGEIADRLGDIADLERQIRKPINRMQNIMADRLGGTLGLNVKRDDIIQTLPWSGIGIKEHGYRLNPLTIILKK